MPTFSIISFWHFAAFSNFSLETFVPDLVSSGQTSKYNCRKKWESLMEGNCKVNDVVYKFDVTRPLPKKVYLGTAKREWKSCFYNHKLSFKHKRCSSYKWQWKSVSNETPNLKCSVLRCMPPYPNISKKCLLCLNEKLEIVTYQNQKELLNKRSEFLC